jgi:hypothetical protein
MYLMWKEGDAIYRRSLSQEIGDMVHAETAKPVEDRLQNTAEIAAKLKNVRADERQHVAEAVKKLIARAVRVSDKESIDAKITEHESLMIWYDSYTDTYWYAKPDKMDVLPGERGLFLNVVDQKTGKYRHHLDKSGAFMFGYVAKMTGALNFRGAVRSMVRYLKDHQGNLLAQPEDKHKMWIGRKLNEEQEYMLQGIQATVNQIDGNWQAESFSFSKGDHCKGCQFRHTCPVNKEEFAEQQRDLAERDAWELARSLEPTTALPDAQPALPAVLTDLVTIQPAESLPVLVSA